MTIGKTIDALTPYARSLGIELAEWEDGYAGPAAWPSTKRSRGGPNITTAARRAACWKRQAMRRCGRNLPGATAMRVLKPINITVQYLSAGKSRTSYAKGRVTKLGRRSANLTVEAWQDDRSRPIATAVMNVLMAEPEG